MKSNYKVLHFDISFYPSKTGSFYRLFNLIKKSKLLSHIVITNTLDGPDCYQGINILRVKRNLCNLFIYYKHFFNTKPDVLFFHNSIISVYLLPLLLLTKKLKIIEIHSIRKSSIIYKFINIFLYKFIFDKIFVLSKSMKLYLVDNYYIDINKINVIYNGFDDNDNNYDIIDEDNICNSDVFKGVYIGSLHTWQGIPNLLEAVYLMKERNHKNIFIEIYGGGPLDKYTQDFIMNNDLFDYIKFHGHLDKLEIPSKVVNVDFLIIPRPSTLATETTVPLKIFEYITLKKPILMSNVGGLTEILTPNIECVTYEPGNCVDLLEKIIYMSNNRQLLKKIEFNSYKKLKEYSSWNIQSKLYEKVIINGLH